ncbi:MAG: diacylglycerol kinase family protein [Sphingorhabdus sp.]
MKPTLLIVNSKSGSAQAVGDRELRRSLRLAGLDIVKHVRFPDEDLPDRSSVESAKIEVVAILSGDGTISSLCQQLAGWDGAILVLPGGTMNLLSRSLHGEKTLPELLEELQRASWNANPVPVVCLGKREVFTGLTVGPSARWGEVREGIRQGDVAELAETVPVAWSETLAQSGVWIDCGPEEAYAGIFVEPVDGETLSVTAFRANNLGDMVGHGIAWLRRDFREGPRDDLGMMRNVTISGDGRETGMLIDGEVDEGPLPLTCAAGMSSVRFLKMVV